jgi:hypothetical protein
MTQPQSPEPISYILFKDGGDIQFLTLDHIDPDYEVSTIVPHTEMPWLAFELLREKYPDYPGQINPDEFRDWCKEHGVR